MPTPKRPLSGRRILVVEDEYLIAIEMERWLQEAGAEVAGPVPDTKRALALIECGVPYLFATGEIRIAEGSDYRSHAVLGKPVLDSELLQAVGRLIKH
jgi:hypothetical protein